MTGFDVFFCIIPQATTVGHQKRQHEARCDVARQETADGRYAADESNSECDQDGQKTRRDQLLDRTYSSNVDAAVIVRHDSGFAFTQTGYFCKLAMDFCHHALGIATDAHHQHG